MWFGEVRAVFECAAVSEGSRKAGATPARSADLASRTIPKRAVRDHDHLATTPSFSDTRRASRSHHIRAPSRAEHAVTAGAACAEMLQHPDGGHGSAKPCYY